MASNLVNGNVSSCKVVQAGAIAKLLLDEVSKSLALLPRSPLLVGYLANQDPAARSYAEWTSRTCLENNVRYELREVGRDDLENELVEANQNDALDGVIVYYPIFSGRQDQYLQQIPSFEKDVEGLSHKYLFKLYHNERHLDESQLQKSILPCTPLAIVKILDHLSVYNNILAFGNRLFGRTITVINRSETVGRPLAAMLANDGASVFSVDISGVQQFTRGSGIKNKMHEVVEKPDWNLVRCLQASDVVISGVPSADFKVPTTELRDGAVCINFSTAKNFEGNVKEKASIYVPSIGKVTIAILIRNLVRLAANQAVQRKDAGHGLESADRHATTNKIPTPYA